MFLFQKFSSFSFASNFANGRETPKTYTNLSHNMNLVACHSIFHLIFETMHWLVSYRSGFDTIHCICWIVSDKMKKLATQLTLYILFTIFKWWFFKKIGSLNREMKCESKKITTQNWNGRKADFKSIKNQGNETN